MTKTVQQVQYLLRLLSNPKLYELVNNPFADPVKLDSLLSTVCYGSLFVSELIKRRPELASLLSKLVQKLQLTSVLSVIRVYLAKLKQLVPEKHYVCAKQAFVGSLDPLAAKLRLLSDYIADVRIFNRMWGLPALLAFGIEEIKQTWTSDRRLVTKLLEITDTVAIVGYQPFENIGFAAEHGWTNHGSSAALWYYVVSSRMWAVFVALEVFKLSKTMVQLKRSGQPLNLLSNRELNRPLISNLANLPLTVHWSLPEGCLSDLTVGFLGMLSTVFDTMDTFKEVAAQAQAL
ncbi:hypothetical protein OGAPHI_006190 [Ogataea philodendri]|uniref:Peroxisomal membrane protein 11C n=1 Tax=Ogataea philodendri TaxID=1378263 RepID=A0A9P8NZQ6_9ASCO|nr:uncharacterized protein OGAPHI_006190 [Ogataea philodendri]KAH3662009.1 hypothetical protein OGAPHI_006190 [Ogataea philodendri]